MTDPRRFAANRGALRNQLHALLPTRPIEMNASTRLQLPAALRLPVALSAVGAMLLSTGLATGQESLAIKAGKIITGPGQVLENQVIIIERGRIKSIGKDLDPGWQAKVIDASDKVVLATYILAHSSGGFGGGANNENLGNVPYLTVEDAVDPSSQFFEECLRNGIGTIHVIPGNRTLLGGQGMLVRPFGRTVEDMAVAGKGSMKLSLDGGGAGNRIAQIRKLRRVFEDAMRYRTGYNARKAEWQKEKDAGATKDEKFAEEISKSKRPILDLIDGKVGAHLYVPGAAEVSEALRIANKYSFPLTFVLGPSCWKATRILARRKQPVVLTGALEYWETDPETKDETRRCPPAELAKAGIEFALNVDAGGRRASTEPTRYPWWQMATCVRHGVSRDVALAAFTTVPAKLLGIADDLGTLEVGKLANLQIVTGDPLAATSWVEHVVLDGELVYDRRKDPKLKHLFGKKSADSKAGSR